MPFDGLQFDLPAPFLECLKPSRYKIAYGGRGSAKSWSFARLLLLRAMRERLLILCTRELQKSIVDSVHRLLVSQIAALKLEPYFTVQASTIICRTSGAQFIFKGLRYNIEEIKSTEGVDIVWIEEAQSTSEESWRILIPTIRREGSEIWLTLNPIMESDPTSQRFIENCPPDAIRLNVNWQDNPWFTETLNRERLYMLHTDPDAYDHVWNGGYVRVAAAAVFRHRWRIDNFDVPPTIDRFFFGADWGFANDPTTLVRCFIHDDILYVDHEAYAVGVEIDEIPQLFDGGKVKRRVPVGGKHVLVEEDFPGIPGCRSWPIKADSARPETISFCARQGFNILPAEKWQGSVEDGIAHLKAFKEIVIHERCVHTAQEFRLYSYKVDKQTEEVLPVIVDKHNHCIDALRYSLDGYIQRRGNVGVWLKLAGAISERVRT